MMKPRLLDAMGEALSLVRKSNLAEATAFIRKALSGAETRGGQHDPEARPPRPPASAFAPTARRPLGEVLRALRARPIEAKGTASERGAARLAH